MRKLTTAAVATAGIIGGALGTTFIAPGLAAAATGASTDAVTERVADIRDALAGLVSDGSITEGQADEVAETLGESELGWGHGHGAGHGPRHGQGPGHPDPDTVADILGVTADELRAAVEDGQTLAQIAEEQGMTQRELVEELVAAAESELAEEVEAGEMSKEQADELRRGLEDRIAEGVDEAPGRRHGRFDGH